jgi:hypothetical protein
MTPAASTKQQKGYRKVALFCLCGGCEMPPPVLLYWFLGISNMSVRLSLVKPLSLLLGYTPI